MSVAMSTINVNFLLQKLKNREGEEHRNRETDERIKGRPMGMGVDVS